MHADMMSLGAILFRCSWLYQIIQYVISLTSSLDIMRGTGNPLQHFELGDGWTNLGMFGFTDYKTHLSEIASSCPLQGSYCIWENEIKNNFFLLKKSLKISVARFSWNDLIRILVWFSEYDSQNMMPRVWFPGYDSQGMILRVWFQRYDSNGMIPTVWFQVYDSQGIILRVWCSGYAVQR